MDGSIDTQLRGANERIRELRDDFRVHHDARGFFVTSDLSFTVDGIAEHATKAQCTVVEPQRTVVEALTLAFEMHERLLEPKGRSEVERFYQDRHIRGLSLDIAPAFTEEQKAHMKRDAEIRRQAAERSNESMNRQLRYRLKKSGLVNVPVLKNLWK